MLREWWRQFSAWLAAAVEPRPTAFTLSDFADQIVQVRRLGPVGRVMAAVTGLAELQTRAGMTELEVERQMTRMLGIYRAMTAPERCDPDVFNGSRRRRIAEGAGVSVADVNSFLRQFGMMREMLSKAGKA